MFVRIRGGTFSGDGDPSTGQKKGRGGEGKKLSSVSLSRAGSTVCTERGDNSDDNSVSVISDGVRQDNSTSNV